MKIRMRLIAASYRQRDVTVELYGRSDDGSSVTALYFGFKPYFYYVNPDEKCINKIKSNDEFISMDEKDLFLNGETIKAQKITVKSPWKVPELRKICNCQALAADIPFHHRFIYDFDLGSSLEIDGDELLDEKKNYSTDYVIKINKINNTDSFNPDLKILSFDVENSIKTREIYVIGYAIYFNNKTETGSITGSEPEILKKFNELIIKNDPDIITGYNIDGYDLPLIEERMKYHNIKFAVGRDYLPPKRILDQYWRLHGRVVSDAWWAVKKIVKPKHETLNYVAKLLLNDEKENIDRINIESEWETKKEEVINYCIKDAYLALEIYKKIRVLDMNLYLSTVSKLPLDDVANGGTSTYVDSILIREADKQNIAVPMSAHDYKDETFEGGYVHTIGAGLYDMVIVLDFKSMYPSMIIKYNICFTTLNKNGTIIAPNGARFLSPDVKKGLIPSMLESLMKDRDNIKRQMKESSGDEKDYLNGLQNAIKILMNTFYGVLGASFYRFTNPEIGGAITSLGRETIKSIIKKLQDAGHTVIYGDTDSIFIESGKKTKEDAIKFGNQLSEEISKEENLTLEFEKIMDPLFSHGAKKRYAGKVIYPESMAGEILVRGYETRRTDSFDLQSEALSKVFEYILNRDIDGAKKYADDLVTKLKNGDKSIEIEKLVISRTVKNFKSYKNADSMANVTAAKKLIAMGETFIPGMKVSWIVTNANKTPQEVEPYIDGVPFTKKPDYDYYSRRLQETLNRVLEGLNKEIKVNKDPQTKLDDLFQEKKKKTIEDFFK